MDVENLDAELWERISNGDREHFEQVKRLALRYPYASLMALDILAYAEDHPESWCAEIARLLRDSLNKSR